MANHSNTQTVTPATRYQMWLGTSQSNANMLLGDAAFSTDDLHNARAVLDAMAKYNVYPFASVLDNDTSSVLSGQDF